MCLSCADSFRLIEDLDSFKIIEHYREVLEKALSSGATAIFFECPTLGLSPYCGEKLGYSRDRLLEINIRAVMVVEIVKKAFFDDDPQILIVGQIGPMANLCSAGLDFATSMECSMYHGLQIKAFKEAGADLVFAKGIGTSEEALGIANACMAEDMPLVIFFDMDSEGNLADSASLGTAIEMIDGKTDSYPMYYGAKCFDPDSLLKLICLDEIWKYRVHEYEI
ncbi:homocysteine S-methyltransferase family protein [Flagellimonas algicola]|uniref:Homocysteine S-methyltransferase family protein n=1 Tax=Flagellimonas algicola TaxID=2583815 RepID=A0ABY2WH02_9FLAO|nr:homocysteine S-methyltransferase family protein [Allomuricauda algicola]TMU50668.1 homocysteine S-methyltransferase family protein [Allomuricauda algicola]